MARTTPCGPAVRDGRLRKAHAFMEAADAVTTLLASDRDDVDPAIALYVHAGIAAADFICCVRLGVHAKGEDHLAAADLLSRADRTLAKDLATLLGMKSTAAYSHVAMTAAKLKQAERAARRLVQGAVAVRGT